MCTVTFIPQKEGFIFSSNRDVRADRSPEKLCQEIIGGVSVIYPKDKAGGGTWIGMSEAGRFACILNGAFEAHEMGLTYRKSRGLILLEFFQFQTAAEFFNACELEGIEPFTIIVWDAQSLSEMRWTGREKVVTLMDTLKPHIWASCTLYDAVQQSKRQRWLSDLLEQQPVDYNSIRHFHRNAGDGDARNDIIMDRPPFVKTVSITHILANNAGLLMEYEDLITSSTDSGSFSLKHA